MKPLLPLIHFGTSVLNKTSFCSFWSICHDDIFDPPKTNPTFVLGKPPLSFSAKWVLLVIGHRFFLLLIFLLTYFGLSLSSSSLSVCHQLFICWGELTHFKWLFLFRKVLERSQKLSWFIFSTSTSS